MAQIPTHLSVKKLIAVSVGMHAAILIVPLTQRLQSQWDFAAPSSMSVVLQTAQKALPKPTAPVPAKKAAKKVRPQTTAPAIQQPQTTAAFPMQTELSESDFKHYTHPVYPRIAQLQGLEGSVRIALWSDAAGKVERVSVIESSGYPVLDEAALKAAREWIFSRPLPSSMRLTKRIIFKIED